jgi:hypothetical protein
LYYDLANQPCIYGFKIQPDETTWNPVDLGLEQGRVHEKIKVVKNPADLVYPAKPS